MSDERVAIERHSTPHEHARQSPEDGVTPQTLVILTGVVS